MLTAILWMSPIAGGHSVFARYDEAEVWGDRAAARSGLDAGGFAQGELTLPQRASWTRGRRALSVAWPGSRRSTGTLILRVSTVGLEHPVLKRRLS